MRPLLAFALLAPALSLAVEPDPHEIASYPLLWQTPQMGRVRVQKGLGYPAGGGRSLRLDLYLPAEGGAGRPLVILFNGAGDAAPREMRRMPAYEGWARLLAAQGMAAVVPAAGISTARADMQALIAFLAVRPPAGADGSRLGLWASSADASAALRALPSAPPAIRAAALLYAAGDASDAPPAIAVLAVRAGRDAPAWNALADRMIAQAEARGLPWTVRRGDGLRHAFDLLDDTEESWGAVRAVAEFLREKLGASAEPLPAARPARAPGPDRVAREALALWRARDWAGAETAYAAWLGAHPRDGVASYRRGVALHQLGRHPEAAEAIGRAVRLGETKPAVLYNLACARSRAGLAAPALDALAAAVREGWSDAETMAGDPDLAPVRAHPRFQALLRALRHQPSPPAP